MLRLASLLCVLDAAFVISAIGCFKQNDPDERQVIRPTLTDCYRAVGYIPASSEKSKAPIIFSHDPQAGYLVPKKWIHGDCGVEIDLKKDADEETTTFDFLGTVALGLVELCVKKRPPHLGGLAAVGNQHHLQVLVFGWRPPQNLSTS